MVNPGRQKASRLCLLNHRLQPQHQKQQSQHLLNRHQLRSRKAQRLLLLRKLNRLSLQYLSPNLPQNLQMLQRGQLRLLLQ